MKPNRLLLSVIAAIVGVLLFLPSSLVAQIEIDVKTKWVEKKELTVAKGGVIAAIEALPMMATTEFGEDYALWLKRLHRAKGGKDTIVLALDLELRKPSLVNEGELIAKRTLTLRYDPRTLDSLYSVTGMSETIANRREEHDAWNRLIGTTVGSLVPKGKVLVGPILTALLRQINTPPKPGEICEGVLIGAQVAAWLEGEIAE